MSKRNMATMIGHMTLKPKAIQMNVARIVEESAAAGAFSARVSPSMLSLDVSEGLQVAYVVGFPSGAVKSKVKAFRAALTVADGVDETDMVISIELAKGGRLVDLEGEIAAVRRVAPSPRVPKAITEVVALTSDGIVAVCRTSMAAGADFVKTPTGSHPAGGASVHAVMLIHATVKEALGVKASDGICDAETALVMIEIGTPHLGVSAANAILAGLED